MKWIFGHGNCSSLSWRCINRAIFNAMFCCGNILQVFGNDLKTCNIVAGILLLLGHVKPPPLTFNATSSQNALQRTENRSMLFTQLQFLRSSIDHSKPDWNDDEKRTLINFYNENQCLWNHQLKDYHDKGGQQIILQQLGEWLDGKFSEKKIIVNTWGNMKTYFNRERIRMEASKWSGSGTSKVRHINTVSFFAYVCLWHM